MSSKRPQAPRVSELNKFASNILGYFYIPNVSPYELVARGLQNMGYAREDGTSAKKFVLRNLDVVRDVNEKTPGTHRRPRPKAKAPETSTQRPLPSSPAPQQLSAQPESPEPRFSKRQKYVTSNAFLDSFEWRQLRMVVLKKYGAKCQCCGATPAINAVINVDHIKPRKLFPELALDENNLQVLCGPCNHGKGNWDMTDWRPSHK